MSVKTKTKRSKSNISGRRAICEEGVATKILFPDEKIAYVIHSPAFYETGVEVEERLRKLGYDVYRLNTGNDYEYEKAKELIKRYCR